MQLFFNLVPRKRLVKRLKEAARALIKTLLFKAALRRWEATTRDTFRSLRLPLVVGVASSRTLPPPPTHPPIPIRPSLVCMEAERKNIRRMLPKR